MVKVSYPAALGGIAALALLPTAIALAFFDGPGWLLSSPFSGRMLSLALLAVAIAMLNQALGVARAGAPDVLPAAWRKISAQPALVLVPVALLLVSTYPALAFSYLKDAIPEFVPFYLDPWLVTADRWLFLGTDPWRVSHFLLGRSGTVFLDKVYVAWFALIPVLAVWIVGSANRNLQLRGLLTIFFIWIVLGNYGAMLLSSCGPVFYDTFYGSDYYDPLIIELRATDAASPLAMIPIAEHLLAVRQTGELGSGISAMPSVHVAITYLTFLLVRTYYRHPLAMAAAALFTVLIWIGSFHLAWHYAWDGIVSVIAVHGFWKLLGFVEVEAAAEAAEPAPALKEQQA